jgi:hypothetical protein
MGNQSYLSEDYSTGYADGRADARTIAKIEGFVLGSITTIVILAIIGLVFRFLF